MIDSNGNITNNPSTRGYDGYCVYVKNRDVLDGANDIDRFDSYEVTTVITFNFPIIQDVLKLRVTAKTNRIYNFECAEEAMKANGKCKMDYDPSTEGVS